MKLLAEYLAEGQAEITAYALESPTVYRQIVSQPCMDMRFDPNSKTFVFWLAGDDKPHSFRARQIEDDDYQAVLYHDHGKVEVGPIWNTQQSAMLERWSGMRDAERIGESLDVTLAEMASEPLTPASRPALRSYQAMLEWHRVEDSEDRWVLVAAWAASEDEIAVQVLERYGVLETIEPYSLMAEVSDPLGALDYWWRQADEVLTRRGKIEPVQAATARDAATIALANGQPKDYYDSDYAEPRTGSAPDTPAGAGLPGPLAES